MKLEDEKGVLVMDAEELFLLHEMVNKHLDNYLDNFPKESANPKCWTLLDKINNLKKRDIG